MNPWQATAAVLKAVLAQEHVANWSARRIAKSRKFKERKQKEELDIT